MIDPQPRVSCESCGAKILESTAEIYDGYCAPCYKRLNDKPPIYQQPPTESLMSKISAFLFPIGFLAVFLIGIPLGYKLILGGRTSTVEDGIIEQITLINQIPDQDLTGREARIVSDYIVIELRSGRKLWIPEENVAGIEFKSDE
ncbi:hypothetical protein HZ994_09450 [Akkermansiaceae bacterium]|nr:hypothetical protein HZ994_09450 [Akkermansiaceae bacterium]